MWSWGWAVLVVLAYMLGHQNGVSEGVRREKRRRGLGGSAPFAGQ